MESETITKADFDQFKRELKEELGVILRAVIPPSKTNISKGLKTKEVRTLFGCSTNKLVALRIARKIRTKKIGGTVYYHPEDIKRVLEDGF
ncbi:helix-turn-helix domain-containing protein [Terrimonas sp. NA20]|uniref:Helix-turn-helix domain-containing protein n=1 Tax=Terrimonas ginsenosidimutans TaxID=2908004 RepID=A0ABS9KSI2_9BACT|nr:helix-turn-helix domain-containing protein [Terrimonas ginsenosidimutans]MCG2615265.1 helix-turn-helix domain-containing protein [Terrimonas ginsenosidimutans]